MLNALRAIVVRVLSLPRRWLGVVIGCLVWILWMITGFWAMLLLMVLCILGYFVGLALERGVTWRDVVERLLSNRDSR